MACVGILSNKVLKLMALSKTKFQDVAAKLFQKASDGDLVIPCVFESLGEYDPITETNAASVSETIDCIREEYNEMSMSGQNVQRGDYKLLAQYTDFTKLDPRIDGVKLTINGKSTTIAYAELDAADAVYTIHVKAS